MRPLKSLTHLLLSLVLTGLFLVGCSDPKPIVNNLNEKEANEIIVYLAGQGIRANKIEAPSGAGGGNKTLQWNITVEANEAVQAMAVLGKVGLPRPPVKSILEVFKSGGLVPSAQEQKIRYQAALEEKIAGTIRKIDGVLDVDVQLSLQVDEDKGEKPTGSVFIKHQGVVDDPNNQLITKIKRLVSGSVDSLDYDQVTVISDIARYAAVDVGSKDDVVREEERNDYVSVWGIVVLKESVRSFQILFFSAVVLVILLFGAFIWVIWKVSPLLNVSGGFKKLFSVRQMKLNSNLQETETEETKEKQEEEEAEEIEEDDEDENESPQEEPK